MKPKLSDLWRWDGTIGRGEYLFCGALLFAVKFNLDRVLGAVLFGKSWTIFDGEVLRLYLWQSAVTRANDAKKWSSSDLTTVFHVACNSAESSTSPATAGPIAQVGGQACASASRPAPACTATSRRSGSTRRALAHSISAASSATRPRRLSARVCFPTISARR